MTTTPEVTVVLVNCNQRAYTAQCLDSLRAADVQLACEIILVDNASEGDDADWLSQRYPECVLVRSTVNRGIAGGNNLGIRASTGKYILLLNNDTEVRAGSLERAARFLDLHLDAAGVGGNLLNPDGTFQSGYVDFPTLWAELLFVSRLGLLLDPHFPSRRPASTERVVDWLSTAFMMFRREALEQVGLVDEQFFIYSDETDLQYRLKSAGWKVWYCPTLNTVHYGGKTLTPWTRRKLLHRGKLLFFRKHYGPIQTSALRLVFAAASGLKAIVWTLAGLVPGWGQRARLERASQVDVLRVCLRLE